MYLSSNQLDALRNYKYTAGMYGFLDTMMTPFWNWAVTLLPLWLAPNLVTLIALLCMLSGCSLVVLLNPTLAEPLPSWALLYCSLCLFLYQTLDAIDGKQARRTGSSSPLGQLFDHGCDSVNVTLLLIIVCGCIQGGDNPFLIAGLFVIYTMPFYMANWEEFQTGVMRFGIVGVTEAQWVMIGIMTSTAVFGNNMWKCHLFGLNVRNVLVGVATVGSFFGSIENIYKVFWDKSVSLSRTYIRRNAIAQAIQFWTFLALVMAWMISPHHKQIFQFPVLPLLAAGLSFSYAINRLIVAHVTHCPEFSACFSITIPLFILNLIAWASSSAAVSIMALYLYSVYIIVLYFRFALGVVKEICECLNICPFSISAKSD